MNTERERAGLKQVRADVDAWRVRRRKGDRIPEEIWRRADRGESARPASPMFVDLSGLSAGMEQRITGGLACVVELEKGNGVRMRIGVREAAGVDWGKIKEAFLEA